MEKVRRVQLLPQRHKDSEYRIQNIYKILVSVFVSLWQRDKTEVLVSDKLEKVAHGVRVQSSLWFCSKNSHMV
jgi:hypothetical protein